MRGEAGVLYEPVQPVTRADELQEGSVQQYARFVSQPQYKQLCIFTFLYLMDTDAEHFFRFR